MRSAPSDSSATTAPAITLPQTIHLIPQNIHIELTSSPLNPSTTISQIRHPSAGANVLFLGTTRDTFEDKNVVRLSYSAYIPMAMRSMTDIAQKTMEKWTDVKGISIVHRLGDVPVGEESIVVGISSGHREAGWRAGEEVLEEVKKRVEIWKEEVFRNENGDNDGEGEGEGRVWKANKDTKADGSKVDGDGDMKN